MVQIRRLQLTAVIFMILFLAGCARTQPSRFYTLSSFPQMDAIPAAPENAKFYIGVGPVEIPDHLERPQIITREGENELELAEFHKWAGSLQSNITTALSENLSRLLRTDRLTVYPWPGAVRVDYQVALHVFRFEVWPEGKAVLSAQWMILGKGGREMLVMEKSDIVAPVAGRGYPDMVYAQSVALRELSREIAESIAGLAK